MIIYDDEWLFKDTSCLHSVVFIPVAYSCLHALETSRFLKQGLDFTL